MKKRLLLFCLLASFGAALHLQAQDEEVFRVAEEMPEYPGCENQERGSARLRCQRAKLVAYIESNLVYPAEAKTQGIEGTAVVSFLVDKDGSLSDIEVLRDIGGGCGEAAKAVINKMVTDGVRWNPGRQRGVPVKVLFNLPVVFKLPAKTISQEIVEVEVMEEEMIEEDIVMEEKTAVEAPPPPPAEEEFFRVVEEMPRFYSAKCEAQPDNNSRQNCAKGQLAALINANLNYPKIARENGVEGTCIVQFVIQADGSMTDVQLLRDPGAGCGAEALRLLALTTKNGHHWVSGTQRGRPVAVQQHLPIKFDLAGSPPPPAVQEKVFIPEEALIPVEAELVRPSTVREKAFPPPPPPRPQVTKDVFKVVEDMPRFLDEGCEALASNSERKSCAQDKMFEYIYSRLEYPEIAKENGIEGTVVIAYIVEKDGSLADIRILRDIGAGCGEEAARIVGTMNENDSQWIPGKQRGRAVRVQFNLPVKFRID